MRNLRSRRKSERLGRLAEWLATIFLVLKGYRILGRRVRTGAGELDIIAQRRDVVAMVEVKYRANRDDAIATITSGDEERLIRAARRWLAYNPDYVKYTIRFDLIAMAPNRWPQHLVSAFEDRC